MKFLLRIGYYVVPTVFLLYALRKYRERKWGRCKNKVKLNGKVAIVTGANSGIGFEIAKELAARKAEVVLACRDLKKGLEAKKQINDIVPNAVLVPLELDLSCLVSVKSFADTVKAKYNQIDILINNAGVSYPRSEKLEKTKDGVEVHFGVNHLAHFYLTNLLLEVLSKTQSRIIVVTSTLHEKGRIQLDFDALTPEDNLYANSKLANVYFCKELANRLKGSRVTIYGCCPGWVYTNLFRHSIKWYHYFLLAPIAYFFMRGPWQGAQTPIYCATEPELANESGLLYRDCKEYKSRMVFYDTIAVRLWEESEHLINKLISDQTTSNKKN